jgi:magnesium transporter
MNPQEPASSSGGVLKARPLLARTHGSDPDTAAATTICEVTPTRCQARTRLYRDGRLELEGFPVAEISDHLADEAVTIWLDLRDPDHGDLSVLSEEFGLHPLAVEDAVQEHQRPKLDRYQSHLFLNAYGARLDAETGQLATSELAAFITARALITVRKDDGLDIGAVVERWDASPDLSGSGIGGLLYGLLDYVVDGHFEAVQSLDDAVETLEDQLFADVPQDMQVQRRSFELRKSLVLLRRIVIPMREVVNALMRRDLHVVREPAGPGEQHPGDQPDHPGQPAERHHQEGHQLGRDHRGADTHHRLLRDERALPRLQRASRLRHLRLRHRHRRRRALHRLQTQGLALRTWPGVSR